MKKIILILLTVFLNMALFSCSPDSITEDSSIQRIETLATGGEDGQTPAGEEEDD